MNKTTIKLKHNGVEFDVPHNFSTIEEYAHSMKSDLKKILNTPKLGFKIPKYQAIVDKLEKVGL